MIKQQTLYVDNVNLLIEQSFCQQIQNRLGHYDHFHLPKNPTVEYHMSNNRLIVSFVFDIKPSCHDINVT